MYRPPFVQADKWCPGVWDCHICVIPDRPNCKCPDEPLQRAHERGSGGCFCASGVMMPVPRNATLYGDSAELVSHFWADTAMLTPIHSKARRNLLGPASVDPAPA